MSKYNIGDKVVIRKDLEVDDWCDGLYWSDGKEYMKEQDYVVIEEVDYVGDYLVEGGFWINDEMIEGLYYDVKDVNIKPKYNVGDKVVIRKDLEVCEYYGNLYWNKRKEYLKEKNYVVIKEVDEDDDYWIDGNLLVSDEMISHKYEDFNSNDQLDYNEIEHVNYKMQHKDLHQSIYNYNLRCQIDKALDENNTELLIQLSKLMKGGVMIDI